MRKEQGHIIFNILICIIGFLLVHTLNTINANIEKNSQEIKSLVEYTRNIKEATTVIKAKDEAEKLFIDEVAKNFSARVSRLEQKDIFLDERVKLLEYILNSKPEFINKDLGDPVLKLNNNIQTHN